MGNGDPLSVLWRCSLTKGASEAAPSDGLAAVGKGEPLSALLLRYAGAISMVAPPTLAAIEDGELCAGTTTAYGALSSAGLAACGNGNEFWAMAKVVTRKITASIATVLFIKLLLPVHQQCLREFRSEAASERGYLL
jgi:hypothetical protein